MKKTYSVILITFLSFGLYFLLSRMFFRDARIGLDELIGQVGISHILVYIGVGLPIFVGTLLLNRRGTFFESLGISRGFLKGMVFSLICTLPMFIGYGIVFEFNTEFSLTDLLVGVVAAAFFEELYFRGFLFGQIFRLTSFGFILSVLLGALLFGAVHLYQGKEMGELAGIFMVTFAGGILFAWAYVEWDYNLWVPIFLHLFMNLSWGLFSAGSNALGGVYSNVFRVATIALVIILTIRYKRKRGLAMEVNRKTVWMKAKQGE